MNIGIGTMRWRGAAGAAVLVLGLTGCGGGDGAVAEPGAIAAGADNPAAAAAPSGTPTSGTGTPGLDAPIDVGGSPQDVLPASPGPEPVDLDPGVQPPAGKAGPGSTGDAEVVEPRPGMANTRTVNWDKSEVRSAKVVRVYFYGGVEPCSVLDSATVSETADTVLITLRSGSDPAKPGAVCIQIAKYKAVDVTLSAPVGDRDIVDGAVDEDVS